MVCHRNRGVRTASHPSAVGAPGCAGRGAAVSRATCRREPQRRGPRGRGDGTRVPAGQTPEHLTRGGAAPGGSPAAATPAAAAASTERARSRHRPAQGGPLERGRSSRPSAAGEDPRRRRDRRRAVLRRAGCLHSSRRRLPAAPAVPADRLRDWSSGPVRVGDCHLDGRVFTTARFPMCVFRPRTLLVKTCGHRRAVGRGLVAARRRRAARGGGHPPGGWKQGASCAVARKAPAWDHMLFVHPQAFIPVPRAWWKEPGGISVAAGTDSP